MTVNGHFSLCFCLSSLLLCKLAVNVACIDQHAIITLPGKIAQLRSAIANWGYQFDGASVHTSNVMLPPEADGPSLCTYPSSLDNDDAFLPPGTLSSPIALLVSRGNCTFQQKAEVALALQQNYSSAIVYVIVYNNDPENFSSLPTMVSHVDFPSLGLLSISTRAGSYVLSEILDFAENTNTSPYLDDAATDNDNNNITDWNYDIEVERWGSPKTQGSSSDSSSAHAFYWLRFVLFTVLILSPCLRAMYLWWSGGGRIVFRRNEQGRITGLTHVRPIPYWFAPTGGNQPQPQSRRLLTEEQVKALPEITFVPPPRSAQQDHDDDDDDHHHHHHQGSVHGPGNGVTVNNLDNDEEQGQAREQQHTEAEIHLPSPTDSEPEIYVPPGTSQQEEDEVFTTFTTSCTTCSICIDDFEAGERIRLLPKCRHAFHTDCIMPWLTERQGCCPLCKTNVLNEDEEETDTAVASDTALVANDRAEASEAPNVHTQRRSDDSPV